MTECFLQVNNVWKEYETQHKDIVSALQDITITVQQNDFVCIVGPSGCGKSTLLRLISGLEPVSKGTIIYRNKPVNQPTAQIGMVFQEYSLLPWRTVLDNVALGLEFARVDKSECKKKAIEYLNLVELSDFARAYPHELSGGMRQRVAIARAMAVEPDILLMDEPFGALDAHTRILLQKELLRVWEVHKKTILFVTHSVDEAIFLADKIIIMSPRPGKIKEVVEVDMIRPRDRAMPRYGQLYSEILKKLDE